MENRLKHDLLILVNNTLLATFGYINQSSDISMTVSFIHDVIIVPDIMTSLLRKSYLVT